MELKALRKQQVLLSRCFPGQPLKETLKLFVPRPAPPSPLRALVKVENLCYTSRAQDILNRKLQKQQHELMQLEEEVAQAKLLDEALAVAATEREQQDPANIECMEREKRRKQQRAQRKQLKQQRKQEAQQQQFLASALLWAQQQADEEQCEEAKKEQHEEEEQRQQEQKLKQANQQSIQQANRKAKLQRKHERKREAKEKRKEWRRRCAQEQQERKRQQRKQRKHKAKERRLNTGACTQLAKEESGTKPTWSNNTTNNLPAQAQAVSKASPQHSPLDIPVSVSFEGLQRGDLKARFAKHEVGNPASASIGEPRDTRNPASDLTKKEEYGHLEQPAATTMNQWGSAACIIQRAVRRQCCVVVSNTAAVPPHALVEYREDVSYYMLKGGGADPAAQHKSTNNASTEAVVRMGHS